MFFIINSLKMTITKYEMITIFFPFIITSYSTDQNEKQESF